MKTNTKGVAVTGGVEVLEQQIAALQNRKNLLSQLMQEKSSIEQRMQRVVSGEEGDIEIKRNEAQSRSPRRIRKMVFPRGVLTAATFTVLQQRNKPLKSDEIVEAVKSSPILHGNVPKDIERRIKGLLVASNQFKSIGNDLYTTAKPRLEGKLFERLAVA